MSAMEEPKETKHLAHDVRLDLDSLDQVTIVGTSICSMYLTAVEHQTSAAGCEAQLPGDSETAETGLPGSLPHTLAFCIQGIRKTIV